MMTFFAISGAVLWAVLLVSLVFALWYEWGPVSREEYARVCRLLNERNSAFAKLMDERWGKQPNCS